MSYNGKESDQLFSLNTSGILVATSANTYATRSITSGQGISVTHGDGVAGNITVASTIPTLTTGSYTIASVTVDINGYVSAISSGTLPLSSTAPSQLGATSSAGSSSNIMRADAVIQYPLMTPASQTGTTYTLQASDHGTVIEFNNSSAITVTLPNSLAVGFNCMIRQAGSGRVTLSAGSGATVGTSAFGLATRTLWSEANVSVRANVGGTAAAYVASGDLAA